MRRRNDPKPTSKRVWTKKPTSSTAANRAERANAYKLAQAQTRAFFSCVAWVPIVNQQHRKTAVNELQERAYRALKTECQRRKKLKQHAESEPVSEKHWPQEPQRECVVYEWPDIYAGQV